MGFFRTKPSMPAVPATAPQAQPLPCLPFDLTRRYDVYLGWSGEERVYENVRFVAYRSFDDWNGLKYTLSHLLEIEGVDGSTALIPAMHLRAVCEHGAKLAYRTLHPADVW